MKVRIVRRFDNEIITLTVGEVYDVVGDNAKDSNALRWTLKRDFANYLITTGYARRVE